MTTVFEVSGSTCLLTSHPIRLESLKTKQFTCLRPTVELPITKIYQNPQSMFINFSESLQSSTVQEPLLLSQIHRNKRQCQWLTVCRICYDMSGRKVLVEYVRNDAHDSGSINVEEMALYVLVPSWIELCNIAMPNVHQKYCTSLEVYGGLQSEPYRGDT